MRASPSPSLVGMAMLVVTLFANLIAGASAATKAGPSSATWMAESIMSRGQGIMTGSGGTSELLQAGITQRALSAFVAQYPDSSLAHDAREYIRKSAKSVVPFTLNASHDALSYPLDRLSTGNALLALSSDSPDNRDFEIETTFLDAADALRESIDLNRRTPDSGLWYFVYPDWCYLDGMWSLTPFWTAYSVYAESSLGANQNSTRDALFEMYYQLELLWAHTFHSPTGLLVHGYDASFAASWADPNTGASPHVWSRSLGWYTMALVDTLEILDLYPLTDPALRCVMVEKFGKLASALVAAVDPTTGGWWQVMDAPGREKNYIESSGSAMFSYALMKGARLGYFKNATLADTAKSAGIRAYEYVSDTFLVAEVNHTLGYNGTVSVCSLNSTASYDYYVGQPINYNSVLGSGAYVLAALEAERAGVYW
ncbi:glycoside hydrolase family 105 protein [Hypomontagnella submonticulosa]|nr:glycoside hydrolase family 105 protein [Hypomontagnella submonticulosa]